MSAPKGLQDGDEPIRSDDEATRVCNDRAMSDYAGPSGGASAPERFRTFASDNNSAVDPRVMQYLVGINDGHQPSYGDDRVTREADRLFAEVFGEGTRTIFVPNGTGANVLAISLLLQPGDAVVTTNISHVSEEESGAVAAFCGTQVFTVPHVTGKLELDALKDDIIRRKHRGFHSALPKVVSIANATEYGTCYTNDEISNMADFCRAEGMYLHLDGCRLPNAAVALGQGLRESSRDLGVDVMSFGGAKLGLMSAEAVVIFSALDVDLRRSQKRALQLVSKLRFVSGQFVPYLREGIWHDNALNANVLAQRLASGIETALGKNAITQPVETNQVFCVIPDHIKKSLRGAGHRFIDWGRLETRLVSGWDNEEADVDDFIRLLEHFREECGGDS